MGFVRIEEGGSEEVLESRQIDGVIEIRLEGNGSPEVSVDTRSAADSISNAETVQRLRPEDVPRFPGWALWMPTLMALLSLVATTVSPFQGTPLAPYWPGALMAVTYVVSLYGFIVLVSDIEAVREQGGDWMPSLWWYVLPATVTVAVSLIGGVIDSPGSISPGYYLGVLMVSSFLAPTVAGPIYLFQRFRHIGLGSP